MRILFIIICLANIAFAFGSLPWMPNSMAVHFAADGVPDGWGLPLVNALLMSLVVGIMAVSILGTSWLITIAPSYSFNMPNRDYWMSEERRPETIRRIRSFCEWLGVWTMLFFLLIQWQIFQANQTVPPKPISIGLYVGILLFVIIFETVRSFLSFRLPKEKRQLDESAILTTMVPNEKTKGDNQ